MRTSCLFYRLGWFLSGLLLLLQLGEMKAKAGVEWLSPLLIPAALCFGIELAALSLQETRE